MSRVLRTLFPFFVGLALFAVADLAVGCPTCKEGMEHDPSVAAMARGYFWSILFMMSMPFLIAASLGGYFYWEIRKARHLQANLAQSLETLDSAV